MKLSNLLASIVPLS